MSTLIFPTLPGATWSDGWSPMFSTAMQESISGKEYRTSLMANPKYKLTLDFEFLRAGKGELQQLAGLFMQMRGAWDFFLIRLPYDSQVTDQPIGLGNAQIVNFQLQRSFGPGFTEPVQNIESITNIKVAGNTMVPNTDYTVSPTGLVTFSAPPVGAVTWTGKYLYRARFVADHCDLEQFMEALWTVKKLELIACLGTKI